MRKLLLSLMQLLPLVVMAQDPIAYHDGIKYSYNGDRATIMYAHNCSGDVVIPQVTSYDIGKGWLYYGTTMAIGESAFSGNTGITSITLPSTVSYMGSYAFSGCTSLATVTLKSERPISYNIREMNPFPERSNIILRVPAGFKAVYENADYWNEFKEIKDEVAFDDKNVKAKCIAKWDSNGDGELDGEEVASITSLGTVFQNDTLIKVFDELKYFTGLTTIGQYQLSGCTNLTSIVLPSTIQLIDRYAFYSSGLTGITIPESVTSIGNSAFRNCAKLRTVTVGSGKKSFGKNVFRSCTLLNKITFDGSESAFNGEDPFRDCPQLKSVFVNDLSPWCKSTFYQGSCNPLYYSKKLELLRNWNDYYKSYDVVENLVIPNDISIINSYAFYGCDSLKSVTIPASVNEIGSYAFSGCSKLTTVTLFADSITSSKAFSNTKNATLYVPFGSKNYYQEDGNWDNDFANIIEMEPTVAKVSIKELGTFSFPYALDFTEVPQLNAYIASGFNPETGELTLTRVYNIPAGEGLLIKGNTEKQEVPCKKTNMYYSNLLKGVTSATTVSPTDGDYTNFILANGEKYGVGFYTLSEAGEIAAGKAYLQLPMSVMPVTEARCIKLVFDDDESMTTGIENVNSQSRKDQYVDLQGRHVSKPVKGLLYIVNGKKYLAK